MQKDRCVYSNPVLNHFLHPRNVGTARRHSHSYLEQDNPWLIRILFTLRVEGDRIEDVKFQGQSCVTTTACASALTELVKGQRVSEALAITPDELSRVLGTIPQEKSYCCSLVIATLRNALLSPARHVSQLHSQEG